MAYPETIKKRRDFVRLTTEGVRYVSPSFIVQMINNDFLHSRLGVTATKKLGNAVCRNRAKRRLRVLGTELIRHIVNGQYDIVFVGRHPVAHVPFERLSEELGQVLKRVLGGPT